MLLSAHLQVWTERFREWLSAEVFKPLQRLLHHVHEVNFKMQTRMPAKRACKLLLAPAEVTVGGSTPWSC